MVSLRDEFEIILSFVSEGNSLIVNCQLSIVNCESSVCQQRRQ